MSNKQGYYEPKDTSGVAKNHSEAAKIAARKKNPISNTEIRPTDTKIDFKDKMYVGYNTGNGYPEFMEIEMEISNTGDKNKISMSGSTGEIMETFILEQRVEDYWTNTDMKDEYGYLADESLGEEPSEEDVENKMPVGTPGMEEDEDAYVEAYNTAYDEAMEEHQEKREEYLENVKSELMQSSHPWEYHDEQRVNDKWYTLTLNSCGQVLDTAKDYTSVIPAEDLDFIVKSWEKHHLFGFFGNDKEAGRSEPTIKTMQRLIKIHEEYEARGGDEVHIKKIVDATGI